MHFCFCSPNGTQNDEFAVSLAVSLVVSLCMQAHAAWGGVKVEAFFPPGPEFWPPGVISGGCNASSSTPLGGGLLGYLHQCVL